MSLLLVSVQLSAVPIQTYQTSLHCLAHHRQLTAILQPNVLHSLALIINLTNYSVSYRGATIEMPPRELELLYFLASSPNQVFTREQLLDHVWGYEYVGDTRTVDVHIKRLRAKLPGKNSWSIATVWGVGYKFQTKPAKSE